MLSLWELTTKFSLRYFHVKQVYEIRQCHSMDPTSRMLYGSGYTGNLYRKARKLETSEVVFRSRRLRYSRKDHVCPKCGNGYTVAKSLNRHLRYECGVAPRFKCPYCGNRGKQRAHVKDHIRRIHSGQRVYIIDSP
ncbi:zinc finger protein 595-like [Hylaeus anthracinus]|uniref:zinc finger protein 595-like n=1 Tax=Hylaeus anthracinus TaxID=313031 RepID=UPI0023B9E89E|nr:zinc finger protein 595-like [Hylaeus anthracinus]